LKSFENLKQKPAKLSIKEKFEQLYKKVISPFIETEIDHLHDIKGLKILENSQMTYLEESPRNSNSHEFSLAKRSLPKIPFFITKNPPEAMDTIKQEFLDASRKHIKTNDHVKKYKQKLWKRIEGIASSEMIISLAEKSKPLSILSAIVIINIEVNII
jgi:hypothetical protein